MNTLQLLRSLRIEKRSYSRFPWRAVTPEGLEVCMPITFDHPDLGAIQIQQQIMGRIKRDCAELLDRLIDEHEQADHRRNSGDSDA